MAGPKPTPSQLHCELVGAKEAVAEDHEKNPPTGVNINVVFTTEEANSPTAGMKIILMIARIVRGRSYRRISDERNVIWQTVRRDIDAIRSVTFK
jgi:hypothetical protein